mmetsp:Transcript_31125/g.47569  ORF Transcript_31125/g.47569 Transcript_31125/m.47569 type:complete len:129 (+) Transcript_31125:61-447(+)
MINRAIFRNLIVNSAKINPVASMSPLVMTQFRTVKSLEDRKEDQQKKAFQDDIQYFLGKDVFTLHDFHDRVLKGLEQKSSFKMMLWGDDVEFKVLESQNKICAAMTEEEKNEEKYLTKLDKKEIAEVC